MKDHPIIFSAPMLVALLDDRKTMTRRLAWRLAGAAYPGDEDLIRRPSPWQKVRSGDRLWVRESGFMHPGPVGKNFWYAASPHMMAGDGTINEMPAAVCAEMLRPESKRQAVRDHGWKNAPSIHMPRWASRLTLVVTAVRFERLQDISDEDCFAEGLQRMDLTLEGGKAVRRSRPVALNEGWSRRYSDHGWDHPDGVFFSLWETLHGPGSVKVNPELVAITFEVHQVNIDQMPAVAKVAA